MNQTTIITALYDIKREIDGDGRKITEYFHWLCDTLTLNAQFIIYIQDTLYETLQTLLINKNIDSKRIRIIQTKIEDIPYYKYKNKMDNIINSNQYKTIIKNPERIECKLSLYNIIQYSKLEWIRQSIDINPYKSDYFFWMDAGCSRFFYNINTSLIWPNISNMNDKIIIQGRCDLHHYSNWNQLHLDSANLLCGTLFGGTKEKLIWLADTVNKVFEELLDINIVNNEQIIFALIWKIYPEYFNIYMNYTHLHLPLFIYLSNTN